MDFEIPSSPEILRRVATIDHFLGAWRGKSALPDDRLERLREASRVRSVASSSRLAGARVSDRDVAAILRGEDAGIPERAEIAGYAAALGPPLTAPGELLASEAIRRRGAVLLGMGTPDAVEPLPWRSEVLHLEAFDESGHALGRVFQTLPPRLVETKTEELLTWLELELREKRNHALPVIAAFTVVFLAISPLPRGNGRMARLLANHLLRRQGYEHTPYASLEAVIEARREEYYDAVDAAETRIWTDEADLSPWIEFFLSSLVTHRDRVDAKLDLERRALNFSPLQRVILETVRDHGTARAGLLLQATGANRNTLKDNLRRLVDAGALERLGQRRGTFYRVATGETAREVRLGEAGGERGPAQDV